MDFFYERSDTIINKEHSNEITLEFSGIFRNVDILTSSQDLSVPRGSLAYFDLDMSYESSSCTILEDFSFVF